VLVVHKSGRVVVPPRYQRVEVHPSGFLASDGYSWGALGLDGNEIVPVRVDRAEALRTLDAAVSIDDGPL
jgi:hypothetical protein